MAYLQKPASVLLSGWRVVGLGLFLNLLSPALLPAFVIQSLCLVCNLLRGEAGEAQASVPASF